VAFQSQNALCTRDCHWRNPFAFWSPLISENGETNGTGTRA
jgi:hypothetical protein